MGQEWRTVTGAVRPELHLSIQLFSGGDHKLISGDCYSLFINQKQTTYIIFLFSLSSTPQAPQTLSSQQIA
jgi:hypothetical protein